MAELTVVNHSGSDVGSAAIPAILDGGVIHKAALHQIVVAHLANQRSGTSKVKTRGEVKGSGKKLFRQKGLGRARMGNIRSPIRVHGGTIFGPTPRSYRQKTPRKMKQLAFVSALRDKLQNDSVIVVENWPGADETPKTKRAVEILRSVGAQGRKALVITDESNDWLLRSARNIPKVSVTLSALLNTYEILTHDVLVVSAAGWDALAARVGGESGEAA